MIGDGDVEAILATGDFDIEVVFSTPVTTRGIFTDATQQTNVLTNEIETVNASIACASSAIENVKRSHTAVIDGETYTVERIEKIGTGVSLVYLKT